MASQATRTFFFKAGLAALAASFPVGLLLLEQGALTAPSTSDQGVVSELGRLVAAQESEIRELDLRILEARGEAMKFEELKLQRLKDLEGLRDRIAALLGGGDHSKSR